MGVEEKGMTTMDMQARADRAQQIAAEVRARKAMIHDCPTCQHAELLETVKLITERWPVKAEPPVSKKMRRVK